MLTGAVAGTTLALVTQVSVPALLPAGNTAADAPSTATTAAWTADVGPASPGDAPGVASGAPGGGAAEAGVPGVGAPGVGHPGAAAMVIPRPGAVASLTPGVPAADALVAVRRAATRPAAVPAPAPAVDPVPGEPPGAGVRSIPGRSAQIADPPAAASGPEAEVVALTNARRAEAGCGALRIDSRITSAAQRHSEDMAEAGYFAHDSRDGRSFADRLSAAGYPSPGAENIAQGQPDAASVVRAWMNSPGHRRNIEDCSLRTIGVGLAGAAGYWTQDFGR